ncbi:hypothetical protein AAFF_G00328630 [Aldrovandia affinis]|uniref:Uncharacterized protein n=1 Tax=Aldrovandia affinis TaxID=143900 RepID=A0AAD7X1M6_9TELE|nr:hypothetical protein AAFF_G00328630 [Aldrovandia affinis]
MARLCRRPAFSVRGPLLGRELRFAHFEKRVSLSDVMTALESDKSVSAAAPHFHRHGPLPRRFWRDKSVRLADGGGGATFQKVRGSETASPAGHATSPDGNIINRKSAHLGSTMESTSKSVRSPNSPLSECEDCPILTRDQTSELAYLSCFQTLAHMTVLLYVF